MEVKLVYFLKILFNVLLEVAFFLRNIIIVVGVLVEQFEISIIDEQVFVGTFSVPGDGFDEVFLVRVEGYIAISIVVVI